MKQALLAAVLAGAALCTLPSMALAWKALAMNRDGAGFGVGGSENAAKVAALDNCRANTGRQCYISTSVENNWTVVAVFCGGQPMTAGSQHGVDAARDVAARKLGQIWSGDCRVVDVH
jgi:hypothetical protein